MEALPKKRRGPPQEDLLREETEGKEEASGRSSAYPIKAGAIGFVLGDVGWIAVYLVSLGFASGPPPSLVLLELSSWLYMGTIVLSVVGLIGLHALQRGSYGGVGRAGFYTILVSSGAGLPLGSRVHLQCDILALGDACLSLLGAGAHPVLHHLSDLLGRVVAAKCPLTIGLLCRAAVTKNRDTIPSPRHRG